MKLIAMMMDKVKTTDRRRVDAPAVSVIMPSYNVSKYIGEAIESVMRQTYTDYEIVVVNDGSPDSEELERVLQPYRDRIVYIKQENQGLSGARNTAIKAARARYVAFLDPDDLWESDYLAEQMRIIESDPSIDVLYPNAVLFGETLNVGKTYMDVSPSEGEVNFDSLVTERCQVSIYVTALRESIIRAGMFDPAFRISNDFDLWLRIVKQGGRIAYHSKVLARRRRHAEALSFNEVPLYREIVGVLDKASTLDLTASERKTLEQQRAKNIALLRLFEGKAAFLKGDFETAIQHIKEANAFFKRPRLALVLMAMRIAPRMLSRIQGWRDRLVLTAATNL